MMKINEVSEYLQKNYSGFDNIKSVTKLKHTNLNSINFLVLSTKGSYVLRNFTDYSKPEKIETICRILEMCKEKKAKVIQPIKNKYGRYVDSKKQMYLTIYQKGTPYNGSYIQIRDIAKSIAILHKVLAKNTISYHYRPDSSRYYKIINLNEIEKIKKIITNKKNKQDIDITVESNINYIKKYVLEDQRLSEIICKLDFNKQLIHSDLHPCNIILYRNKVMAILDFNDMKKNNLIEDIAFAGFRFALYQNKDIEVVRKRLNLFINTYTKYNQITQNDLLYMKYFFKHETLRRLSYILRKKYFYNSELWIKDTENMLNFLKLSSSISIQKITRFSNNDLHIQ